MIPFWSTSTKSVMMLFFAQVRSVESINNDDDDNDDHTFKNYRIKNGDQSL